MDLISYHFQKFTMVRSENERSRRVLEKAGMSYRGMVDYRESQWPCYVICNNKLELSQY